MVKVLVTGATGFIGNHIVAELLRRNVKVIATSRNIEKAKKFEWFSQVTYVPCTLPIDERTNYYEYFHRPSHIIHLAWEGLPNYLDVFHFERNLYHNYFFLKNLIINGLKDVSVIGTCLEYGLVNGCLSEQMPTNPHTAYGLAKDTLRRFLELMHKQYDFNFKWIRLFYTYGKGQSEKSLLAQLDKALENGERTFNMSGGEQIRDYLPVEKVAEYIVEISLQQAMQGIFNCCSGNPISIRKLVENYLTSKGKKIALNLGYFSYLTYEPFAFWGDNTKLKSVIKNDDYR
ncbi:NAD-dependent epimerase/dehydratase family protein [Thermoflexibacter ruber]|uniref:dTDP-6-deoxy-L-talose 4-dehydrogenase (NAD+) n=1 Tax=Thermoflexibacter ruber TaxID=1003 RepID=A0A1I2GMX3_9BACT|nr:NAD-dependent epimerase/dehydratase family protein [Thermoflexibacter ruber]SFF18177.1 dTDP-6-deoxy-L-talose 4-dehydrogenase (NAD+) [Thermoflexibacter ruber]